VFAQTHAVVAPANLASEDATFGSGWLAAPAYRVQEAYGAEHFPTQALIITELRFRPDRFYGQAFTTAVASIQFNLSTTTHDSEALSANFADNTGDDETIVFLGSLTISSQFGGPTNGPKDFDIVVPLRTPFLYNPAVGNLLLDVRNYSGSTASLLSGQVVNGDGGSRLGAGLGGSSGEIDTGVDALEVIYVPTNIPPPPPRPLQLTRGPYLQSGTTSNVVVRWRTQRNSESRVQFGLDGNALLWEVSTPLPTTEHSVTLTNLAAGTKYFYRIGSSETNLAGGPEYFFLTAPLTNKPTRIWAIGDAGTITQFGYTGQPQVRDAYYAYTGSRYTDVWLMLGDNAYWTGLDFEYQAAVFEMYQARLRSTVLWSTIGNHDAASGDYMNIFTFPVQGEGGGVASGTKVYYSFDYGNIHFVCLDSDSATSNPTPGSPMLNWLEQDLAANTKDWLIAFWHEPPYSKGSHDSDLTPQMTLFRQNVNPILESYGVDLVLCGHSHVYERTCLLNAHYGFSQTLVPGMVLDGSSGRTEEAGAYLKPGTGPVANQGAVYVVSGSSGWVTPSPVNHPAMYSDPAWRGARGLNQLGSMVIDIDGNRLDAKFLRETGAIDDHFTIIKGAGPAPLRLVTLRVADGAAQAQWKSIAGHRYQLEKAPRLEDSAWTPASPIVTATGATTVWSGEVDPSVQGHFFRIADLGP